MSGEQRVVLVGAGHAHLYVAARAAKFRSRGVELVVVDPGRFWYSGLATGMLGGEYEPDDDQVDVGRLVEGAGGRFLCDRVVHLDPAARTVTLGSGPSLSYRLVSFNIGSVVADEAIEGVEHAIAVKPLENLSRLRGRLERAWTDERGHPVRVVVIGGGATGCEVAANVLGLAQRRGARVDLTLLAGVRLMPEVPHGASDAMARSLTARGAHIEWRSRAARIDAHAVDFADGRRLRSDATVLATGLKPPPLLREIGLPTADDGGVRVDATLRCVDGPAVFGAGDCIHFDGRPLPKLGVFGVRQAPVLLHNLLASLDGDPLRVYRPQKRWLSILNLGDGRGVAIRAEWWYAGRPAMWLKRWLDERFVRQYRR